ncbi:MAG TPA: DoxX family membrane protein [Terriglobales bacterium]|nr:DoxX family membrane protein [Terriglobales bacterium]
MGLWAAQTFTAAFLAVLFLQSGLDKLFDYEGNEAWLKQHFSQSLLGGSVPLLLKTITVVELAAGSFSLLGAIWLFFGGGDRLAGIGAFFAALAILMLFTGQRLAKDYAGAAVLVPYFLLTLVGLYLF